MVQTSDKQTEIDFQMNANELYPIVKPAIIVEICEQTGLMTSFIENAIRFHLVNSINTGTITPGKIPMFG